MWCARGDATIKKATGPVGRGWIGTDARARESGGRARRGRARAGARGVDRVRSVVRSVVEEIVVNEFQAYMATERVLFGPDASAGKSSSSKKSSGGRRRAVDALAETQRKFCAAARDVIVDPPRCGNLTVVWVSS